MIFLLSNSKDATCDFVHSELLNRKIPCFRLNTDFAPGSVEFNFSDNTAELYVNKIPLRSSEVCCVWNRRPEKIFAGNFSTSIFDEFYRKEWKSSIESFLKLIPSDKWINHPQSNLAASSKIEQLVVAKKNGLEVPDSLVTQSKKDFDFFYEKHSCRIITKPLSHGYLPDEECIYNIYTNSVDAKKHNFNNLKDCPTFFQQMINKECDVRINFIDGYFEAFLLINKSNGTQQLDIRRDNMQNVQYKPALIPKDIQIKLSSMLMNYGLRFAAIDMCISKNGTWFFLEINPNGQWAWLDILGLTDFRSYFIKGMLA